MSAVNNQPQKENLHGSYYINEGINMIYGFWKNGKKKGEKI